MHCTKSGHKAQSCVEGGCSAPASLLFAFGPARASRRAHSNRLQVAVSLAQALVFRDELPHGFGRQRNERRHHLGEARISVDLRKQRLDAGHQRQSVEQLSDGHRRGESRLVATFGERIVGLKDSSGDLPYSRAAAEVTPGFRVFPSNEATLLEARTGVFAGCISATANLNADLCGRAFHQGDEAAHKTAVAIRGLFDGLPLVAGVKALLAHIHGDGKLAETLPPLAPFPAETARAIIAKYEGLRQTARELQPA